MNGNTPSQERFERIEAYLLGTLPVEEHARFEADMSADADLRHEVELQREHITAIALGGFSRTLAQAAQRHAGSAGGGRVVPLGPPRRNWLAYAAALAALVAVAAWMLLRPPLNERLYAEFHVPDPGLPVPMSASDDALFHDAMVAYKLGDHQEAFDKWVRLKDSDRDTDTLRFYIGCAALESGLTQEAFTVFSTLAGRAGPFQEKARGMLFMAALRLDRAEVLDSLDLSHDPLLADRARKIREALGRP